MRILDENGGTREATPEEEKGLTRQQELVSSVADLIEEYGDDFFDP